MANSWSTLATMVDEQCDETADYYQSSPRRNQRRHREITDPLTCARGDATSNPEACDVVTVATICRVDLLTDSPDSCRRRRSPRTFLQFISLKMQGVTMMDLATKTILLTGASSGIGAETAKVLGESGAHVIAHYVDDLDGVEHATRDIPDDRKLLLSANFEEPGSARRLWREALSWRGVVDVLVNNAAIMPETALSGSDEEWDQGWARALQVNLVEPSSLTREAVLHFVDTGGGIVISLSSWAAQRGSAIATLSAYAATKSAIKALTQTIARNYAKDGVLAYVVAPGIVRTSMSLISATARGGDDAVKAILPLGDLVPTSEVANMVAFLSSGLCRHLTGATIDMNGAAYIR